MKNLLIILITTSIIFGCGGGSAENGENGNIVTLNVTGNITGVNGTPSIPINVDDKMTATITYTVTPDSSTGEYFQKTPAKFEITINGNKYTASTDTGRSIGIVLENNETFDMIRFFGSDLTQKHNAGVIDLQLSLELFAVSNDVFPNNDLPKLIDKSSFDGGALGLIAYNKQEGSQENSIGNFLWSAYCDFQTIEITNK